jgi:hypothetical protein
LEVILKRISFVCLICIIVTSIPVIIYFSIKEYSIEKELNYLDKKQNYIFQKEEYFRINKNATFSKEFIHSEKISYFLIFFNKTDEIDEKNFIYKYSDLNILFLYNKFEELSNSNDQTSQIRIFDDILSRFNGYFLGAIEYSKHYKSIIHSFLIFYIVIFIILSITFSFVFYINSYNKL